MKRSQSARPPSKKQNGKEKKRKILIKLIFNYLFQ